MSPVRRRLAISLVVLAQVVAACGSSGTPSPTPAPTGPSPDPSTAVSPVATPGPSVTPSPTPAPTPTPTATPEPTPSPTPTPAPTAPTAKAFWARVVDAVKERGRLRIRVIGPSPGELRYQTDASATAMNGEVVFVCVGDRAWDGQAGFDRLPGKWACGANALVAGFRTTGAPLDAWSVEIPQDEDVDEKVSLGPDGSWRWRYTATSPTVGGEVRATVVVDPATGQILSASRSDPTGETTYGISYTDPFPPITPP